MQVHLVDGTWELFRYFHAVPSHTEGGREVGAVRAVLRSMVGMLEAGATHLAVATDHVIESFRNDLWPGYKTGAGIDPDLLGQFHPLEEALAAAGVTVWPMVEFEADDALATGAALAAADPRVDRVVLCSPDKDLAQCVRGDRVVQLDRRGAGVLRDEDATREKFGVAPALIPDWLALVGDAADGYPGVPGFGAKGAAAVLTRLGPVRDIPDDPAAWAASGVRGHARLANTLAGMRERALLFVRLATLRTDVPVMPGGVDDIRWRAPRDDLPAVCARIGAADVPGRLAALAATRA